MGEITDDQVEWAVVDRLKKMLDDPPKSKFNVTQSFAHFSAILLWTKNRAWVRERDLLDRADHGAAAVRADLRRTPIFDQPWLLSRVSPVLPVAQEGEIVPDAGPINGDFDGMSAEDFFKWLRDAIAHGDGRTIRPLHKPSIRHNKIWLAGFTIEFAERHGSDRNLVAQLYHQDMTRMGRALADRFCQALRGQDNSVADAANEGKIEEAA